MTERVDVSVEIFESEIFRARTARVEERISSLQQELADDRECGSACAEQNNGES